MIIRKAISILSAFTIALSCGVTVISAQAETESKTAENFEKSLAEMSKYVDHLPNDKLLPLLISDEETESKIAEGTFEKGDYNCDGKIDCEDLVYSLATYANYIAFGMPKGVDEYEFHTKTLGWSDLHYNIADVNSNGRVDAMDTAIVLERLYNEYLADGSEFLSDSNNVEFEDKEGLVENYFSALTTYSLNGNIEVKFFDINDVSMGDSNLDGDVDSSDAVVVLKSYATNILNNTSVAVAENNIADFNSDVNLDGEINSADASAILKTYAKNIIK